MKKFLSLFAAIFFAASMMADYELVYTLDGSVTDGGNSNYAQDGGGLTQNGIEWSVTGNTTINPWRIGGKNLEGVDRLAYSKTAIADDIAKIEIEHGTKTLSAVNSMKVEVASDAAFANIVSTFTPTYEPSATVTVVRPDGASWANCYYRITYNVNAGSSNSYLQLVSVKFYKEGEGGVTPPVEEGCNWDEIAFLGNGSGNAAYTDRFKVCAGDPAPTSIVNIQAPAWAAEAGIYVTFPSAAFGAISLENGQYAIDGAGMILYASAFLYDAEKEVTIVCQEVTYTLTVKNANPETAPVVPITCAAVYSLEKNAEVALNNVVVTYANGRNVFVKDETGSMLLYLSGNTTWEAGNILSGVQGTLDIYNGLYEVKMTADQATAVQPGQGEAPAPIEFTAAPVAADMNKYIVLKNVTVSAATFPSNKNMNATIGEETFVLRNQFNADVAFETTKEYDIIGAVALYNSTVQVYFINATESTPAVEHNYTVAGDNAELFINTWDPENIANNLDKQEDGTYKFEKTEVTLPAGNVAFKVVMDHDWNNGAWPAENYILNIPEAGIYTITITFNEETKAVAAEAVKTGDAVVIPTIAMHGNFLGSWADTENFADAEGNETASLTLNLAAGSYEFGMRIGGSGNWTSNGAAFTRENNSAVIEAGQGNLTLAADAAGEYTFTWTHATNTLTITFPAAAPAEMTAVYDWTGEIGTTILGIAGVEISTVKIHGNEDQLPAIKFGNSYAYADGKYIAIKPAEGKFLAGDVIKFAGAFSNDATDGSKYAQVIFFAADGSTQLHLGDAVVNGKKDAADPTVESFVLAADQDSILIGRYGNTALFVTMLKVERAGGVEPQPQVKSVSVFGTMTEPAWEVEIPFALSDDQTYASLTVDHIGAGDYNFKFFVNGAWRSNGYTYHRGFPAAAGISGNDDNNMIFQADVDGEYTFKWYFENDSAVIIYPELPFDCDWENLAWLGGSNDKIKVCVEQEGVNVVNVQNPHWSETTEDGIYMGFPSAAWGAISLPEGKYEIQGAGILVFLSALTEEYNDISIVCQDVEYILHIFNANNTPQAAYYLVGDMNEWNAVNPGDEFKFAVNPNDANEYVLHYTLVENQKFKVVEIATNSWYPAEGGEASNYVIDAAHAGEKDIYFRPNYSGGNDWHYGCIYVAPNVVPSPDAAPAEPTYANYQVKAVYSAKYNADCNFSDWGSGTAYAQEEYGKKFVTNDMGWFGLVDFGALNCTEMEKLHVDVWAAADGSLNIYPIYGGEGLATDDSHSKTLQLVGGQWNSFDLDLATEFAGLDLSSIFQIKIAEARNMTFWLNNIYFYTTQEKTVDIADGYYLIGTMNSWDIHNLTADHLFAVNPANEAEYVLHYTLVEGDKFKVVNVANNEIAAWFPAEGSDYEVNYAHAGEKDIYFRPDYQGGEGWHAGCIYVEANPGPEPLTIPTDAPVPTVAEDDVMAIYCNHYANNNANFGISGWAGGYQTLVLNEINVGYWTGMTWECIIDPVNTDAAHDYSAYKNLHVDLWAPLPAKIKFTAEAVAGGNYKDGMVVEMQQGWNNVDFVVANWAGNYDFKNLKCFVFEQYQTLEGESFEGHPFAFANIYFYGKEAQGIDNTNVEMNAVKFIENGQLIILKNGVKYNVMGVIVR